jgi:hypothetical protein
VTVPATDEQRQEIRQALQKARAARGRGEDPQPFYDEAEALMRKYGVAEEVPVGGDGEPL